MLGMLECLALRCQMAQTERVHIWLLGFWVGERRQLHPLGLSALLILCHGAEIGLTIPPFLLRQVVFELGLPRVLPNFYRANREVALCRKRLHPESSSFEIVTAIERHQVGEVVLEGDAGSAIALDKLVVPLPEFVIFHHLGAERDQQVFLEWRLRQNFPYVDRVCVLGRALILGVAALHETVRFRCHLAVLIWPSIRLLLRQVGVLRPRPRLILAIRYFLWPLWALMGGL